MLGIENKQKDGHWTGLNRKQGHLAQSNDRLHLSELVAKYLWKNVIISYWITCHINFLNNSGSKGISWC